ncbi:uncharacterized protein LOC105186519 [Harpegnathos saltator]|uniref:uncharacterized protein LOC105186519 n=1 Tax=Harpegnathos saltator TaxID=610380 RepID=UPI00058ACB5C|nr:uncharacterized protein LOC105186519 [Harpegnathos saltator]
MAATTLADCPPVELLADERSVIYWRIWELRERGDEILARGMAALKSQAVARTLERWVDAISNPREFGRLTTETVRPCLEEMAGRRGRGLTYHLMQVITGHGSFGHYLHRKKKELTTECHHCPERGETVQHTLAAFEAWSQERGRWDAGRSWVSMVDFPCVNKKGHHTSSAAVATLSWCRSLMATMILDDGLGLES